MIRQTTDVDLRVAIPVPGIVEFWRGAVVDAAFDATSDGLADLLNKADIFDSADRTPAIYEWMRQNKHDIDLIISYKSNGPGTEDILVQEIKGDMPSSTWTLRQKLITLCTQRIVGPVLYFKDVEKLLLPRLSGLVIF
ncbi:hypothetical protein E8E13_007606 [Curvularia kusanoi]|uniref:Uncharacterized protein n=1 Tax=Curvularia kusanoi TaxID=90978 RepID=A0A9P4TF43_CURKU|nr:hypothetical protein E8E13_007606 [Curvularia kusanoi]